MKYTFALVFCTYLVMVFGHQPAQLGKVVFLGIIAMLPIKNAVCRFPIFSYWFHFDRHHMNVILVPSQKNWQENAFC